MKYENIKKGMKFSRHSFGEVLDIVFSGIIVKNEQGVSWTVTKDIVENEFNFSDVFEKVEEKNQTDLAKILLDNKYTIMTVNFNKKVDKKDVELKILELYPNKGGQLLSESSFKEKVKEAMDHLMNGEERTCIGYHRGTTDTGGRVYFQDMTIEESNKTRLVNPLTVNYITIKNVKYVLK